MQPSPPSLENIVRELYLLGAIKFGKFTLKNGSVSPVYIDLRQIISSPALLTAVTATLWKKISAAQFDLICGIPYTALPLATCMSLFHNLPMILRRKEKKSYGTQQMIEGKFQPGQVCLLMEDVITSGSSVIETANDLEAAGLVVQDVIVFIDREQGGKTLLQKRNYNVHSALTLKEILQIVQRTDVLTASEQHLVTGLLQES